MNASTIFTWILYAVIAYIAIKLLLWLFGVVIGILQTVVIVAIIIGVIYLLYQIFGRKRVSY